MQQALLIRLRPSGPWRYGPADGALDRVDTLYRSDRLYSAVTLAMRQLGLLDEWLSATARAETSAVAFSSLFPFQGDTLFATPPANLWPPPAALVNTSSPVFLTKIRWRAAHFVPLSVVDSLLTSQPILADQWQPDAESGCLLRRDRPSSSPFRVVLRSSAAVDRLSLSAAEAPARACVEFEPGSGLWTLVRFHDEAAHAAWNEPVQAAFKLLADSGFGGGRTRGWGQTQPPEFEAGSWPAVVLPKVGRLQKSAAPENGDSTHKLFWLLSLYSPAAGDTIDWAGGEYELAVRSGRVESSSAAAAMKKSVRMVLEGCVLSAASEPVGTAVDVAPEGMAHPVYRSGIALSLQLPPPKPVIAQQIVEPAVATVPEIADFSEPLEPIEEPAVTDEPVVANEPTGDDEPVVAESPVVSEELAPAEQPAATEPDPPQSEEPSHEI
jgi:CRISPR type III-A-associated RAMP protein Csm4